MIRSSIKRHRLIFLSLAFFVIAISGYIFVKPAFNQLSGFLSKSEQVPANILLVEGWLSQRSLETAANEFRKNNYDFILTTGLKSTPEYYGVSMDGYLIFYTKSKLAVYKDNGTHTIEIAAKSELGGNNSAHFNFWINDKIVSDFSADKREKRYAVTWEGSFSDIDSVMIQFDNDKMGDFGDRNLFIKEIIFDGKVKIPFLNFSEYDITELDGRQRIKNNLTSNADMARRRLILMGIDSVRIISVPGEKAFINRTLTSAIAVREWLKTSEIKAEGINILSSGTHSRRTWMTFSKVLDDSCQIGIISIPDYKNNRSTKRRLFKTIRETAAIIYYWLILIPY
jgi:hypothetical protein